MATSTETQTESRGSESTEDNPSATRQIVQPIMTTFGRADEFDPKKESWAQYWD